MKLLSAFVLAALSLPFGTSVYAQSSAPGLTRAEVRAQLIQAEKEGLLPWSRGDYPPSERTVERNRELYAIRHPSSASTSSASMTSPSSPDGPVAY
jgi:hypothetical protein